MSSELSGQKTELPGETGTGTGADDPGRAIAGQNITMSRRELRALSDSGSVADRGGTVDGTAAAGSPARAEAAGTGGQDGRPAAEGSAGPAGSRTETGTADGVTTGDESGGAEGQPEGGTIPDLEPEGAGANEGQESAPAAEVTPGPAVPGAGDSGFPRQPGTETSVVGDGVQNGAVGGRAANGPDDSFGRGAVSRGVDAGEPGEQGGDERPGPDSRSSADSSESARQGEGNSGEKDADGRHGDSQAQRPKDQVHVQQSAPDAGTDHPGEAAAESAPDQQTDDPRWAAMEQRMERMVATVEALQDKQDRAGEEIACLRADYDTSEARNKALTIRIDELTVQHDKDQARIDELTAKVEAGEADRVAVQEKERSGDKQPARSNEPDAPNADVAEIVRQAGGELATKERVTPEIPDRQWITMKNATAVTSVVSFGSSIAAIFAQVPPEIAVGPAAVGVVSGILGSTVAESIRKKRKG